MIKKLFPIAFGFTALLVLLTLDGNCQIAISDTISGVLIDTVYLVEDTIIVAPGDSLIIEPGAVLLFNFVTTAEIFGYFYAVGTEEDSIIFCSASEEFEWSTINFRNSGYTTAELGYCHFSQASKSAINIFFDANVHIHHSTVENNHANWGGGIYISYASPLIEYCVVRNNWSVNNGGGIYNTHSNSVIENCLVYNNSSDNGGGGSGQGGGGICANHGSSVTINNCLIYDNDTFGRGGGIVCNDESNAYISRSAIYGNSSTHQGGGLFITFANPVIENCTIYNNSADSSGSGMGIYYTSLPDIKNCLIYNNNNVGVDILYAPDPEITYSDIFGNTGGEIVFDSLAVPGLGINSAINANGDSCDVFFNIMLEPLLVDPLSANFALTANSPCIDAGSPFSALDPDGTVADIGAMYFPQLNQNIIADLVITMQGDNVYLSWTAIPAAEIYHIYRAEEPYFDISGMTPLGNSITPEYLDVEGGAGEKWFYAVSWE